MFLNIGAGFFVRKDEIIAICDMDSATYSKRTREFLSRAESEGRVITACDDVPKSFIISDYGGRKTVWLCQPGSAALKARAEQDTPVY